MHLEEYLDVVAKNSTYYPPKTVLLTFDDGYHNNATEVYPLLQQLGWCATIFLIAGAVGNDPRWLATGADQKMTAATLLQLSPATVQYGYHGYQHEDFGRLTIEEVEQIVQQSASALQHAGIPMQPVLAYPYGARPKDPETLRRLKQMLQHNGLQAAFRIGNKVSTFPVTDRYEIKRIDIRGGDTLKNFKTKVTKGRLKPF